MSLVLFILYPLPLGGLSPVIANGGAAGCFTINASHHCISLPRGRIPAEARVQH